MCRKDGIDSEEIMEFRLAERFTFLEYVPVKGVPKSASAPDLLAKVEAAGSGQQTFGPICGAGQLDRLYMSMACANLAPGFGAPAAVPGELSASIAIFVPKDLGFSSDEEDSEDITPAPYAPVQEEPEAQNQPEEGNAENLEGDLEKQSDHAKLEKSKPRPEKAVSRVARLWDQHARAREQREDIDLSDRLEASKDYRTWVTSVDIDLQPGEAAPNFTEVWVELQNLHKRQKVSKEEPDWKWSEPSDWRHWGRWSRWKEDWDGEHKEARIVLAPAKSPPDPPVLREVRRASPLALKPAPRGDPLADFAAEASITYLRERNASDPQRRRGASTEPHRLRHHRRPEKPRGPPRAPRAADLAGRERLARACYSRSESLRIFDEALQELSARGQNELPITASVILSEIEQRHGDFLYDTPFEVFSDLLDAAAEDGMIEVSRRNRQELVTWAREPRSLRRRAFHAEPWGFLDWCLAR
ncbi:unnamed protein product [Durusdinium trenchii]|uniref:Uncharacterized protein n=1 Tax=Durusdinium trenchii TaxID=1381693 RepID=A0ABP0Q4K3_9DINO